MLLHLDAVRRSCSHLCRGRSPSPRGSSTAITPSPSGSPDAPQSVTSCLCLGGCASHRLGACSGLSGKGAVLTPVACCYLCRYLCSMLTMTGRRGSPEDHRWGDGRGSPNPFPVLFVNAVRLSPLDRPWCTSSHFWLVPPDPCHHIALCTHLLRHLVVLLPAICCHRPSALSTARMHCLRACATPYQYTDHSDRILWCGW